MTPKDKAIELYNKFINPSGDTYLYGMLEHESAKECALIAVEEILSFIEDDRECFSWKKYYQEVKKEIEKL